MKICLSGFPVMGDCPVNHVSEVSTPLLVLCIYLRNISHSPLQSMLVDIAHKQFPKLFLNVHRTSLLEYCFFFIYIQYSHTGYPMAEPLRPRTTSNSKDIIND